MPTPATESPDLQAVTSAALEQRAVDQSLAHGVAWTGAMKAIGQATAWASTLVVARLLSPDDYGIVGMATLYLGLLQAVSEFGIGIAVVTRRELTSDQIGQLNSVSVMMGALGAATVALTAPLLGRFFHNTHVAPVLGVLGLTFLVSSFRSVPWGILERDLRFKRLAVYDAIQSICLAFLSIILAWLGFRYWTLVCAALGSAIISTGLAVAHKPVPLYWPDVRSLRRVLSFSTNIVFQRIAWYSYSNADFLVAGRMLGSGPLGLYSLAWNLSHATDRVSALVLQVTPAVLSRVQDNPDELRRYVIRVTEALAIAVMPLTLGLALVAPDFVNLVLGPKWIGMVLPLQLLSAYGTVNIVLPLLGQVINTTGHEAFGMRHNFIQLALMTAAFVAGARAGGITGIAVAWVVVHPFLGFRLARYALRLSNLTAGQFVHQALWTALRGCLAMAAAVLAVRYGLPESVPLAARLTVEVLVGATVYAGTLLMFNGTELRNKYVLMRQLLAA